MRILQILPELNVGGVETGVVDLAKELVNNGHHSVVISNGGSLVPKLTLAGSRHYRLPVHKKSPFTILRMIAKVANIIEKEKIEIVHARSRVPAWIAYFASKRRGVSFITTAHGYYNNYFFSRVMGWGKRVIVPSRVIGRHMIEDFKVQPQKIVLIPRGVDLDKFNSEHLRFQDQQKKSGVGTIGLIGRITPGKGHLDFVKAVARVVREMPQLKVLIVGDVAAGKEKYRDEMNLLVRRLGLTRYVHFISWQKDIPKVLSQLDILVVPSTIPEAFGRVIIEAQASGVPVIATNVGGIVDIIEDKQNGILIPPQDPAKMAKAIVELLKNKELAFSLAQKAREKVEREFDLTLMFRKTLELYQKVRSQKKILIIKLGALGDLILAIPSLQAIRRKFPNARISLLTGEKVYGIIYQCPYLNEIIVYQRKGRGKIIRMFKLAQRLKQEGFDIGIDLQNNWQTHLILYLSKVFKRYGYDRKGGFLLTDKVPYFHTRGGSKEILPPVKHQLRLLNLLKINQIDERLELWTSPEDERYIENFLSQEWIGSGQRIIAINLFTQWETKNWGLENLSQLATKLMKLYSARIVLIGESKYKKKSENFQSLLKNRIINAVGKTNLGQLIYLIKRCELLITPDSAAMHIAAAVKTPFVALFGPTDPQRHLPPAEKFRVIKKNLPCSPCYKHNCLTKKCMKKIKVDDVLEAVKEMLE